MARLNFNAATVDPQKPLEIIPADWYPVQIIESEAKPTKDGKGSYLLIKMEVMGGQHNKHILFDRFNLDNTNKEAVEIAYRQLSAVCHATGVIQCEDSQQLHGRPMMAKVTVTPAAVGKDGKNYDAKNEIDGYKAMEQSGGFQQAAAAAPAWASTPPTQQFTPPQQQQAAPAPAWAAPATPQQQPAAAQTPAQQQPWNNAPAAQTPPPFGQPWAAQPPAQQPPAGATPWGNNPAAAQAVVQQSPTSPAAANTPPWAR